MFGFGSRQPRVTTQRPTAAYLPEKSELDGTLRTDGGLRVDGIIHGDVEVRGHMEISETGLVEGTEIRATNLTIHGVAKARIVADECLTLSSTGRLEGDITAASVNIQPGAFYVGYIATTDARALPASGASVYDLQASGHNALQEDGASVY